MLSKKIFLLFVFIAIFSSLRVAFCQDSLKKDTLRKAQGAIVHSKKTAHHSPAAATILSACAPGFGQIYNKKYWKPPIIYAAMGTTVYFFLNNNMLYKRYKTAYIARTDTAAATTDDYPQYSADQLHELSDYYHRYRDLNVMLTVFIYTLNIADAYVDAHLRSFDISDNLTMTVLPSVSFSMQKRNPTAGVTLSFRF